MPPAGEPRSGCPTNATIEVLGNRWSLLVLRDVMVGNRRHFRELQPPDPVRRHARRAAGRAVPLPHSPPPRFFSWLRAAIDQAA